MPTTTQIQTACAPDDNSLTKTNYAQLKLATIAEIEETTKKGRQIIDNVVIDKTTAIVDLQRDYDSIHIDWDKTKVELDLETKNAIPEMKQAKDESRQMATDHDKISQDLKTTKIDIADLHENMDTIISKVQTAVKAVTDDLVSSTVDSISTKNEEQIQNMDDVFTENMDVMQRQSSTPVLTANIEVATAKATDNAITRLHNEMDVLIVNMSKDSKRNQPSTIQGLALLPI